MNTHKEALEVLNCSKMTLSRYVKDGKLTRIKKGRRTFYDKREVALLAKDIQANKRKYRTDLPQTETRQIELPKEVQDEIQELSADSRLNKVGMQTLQEATKSLDDMGLYKECDKQALLQYALSIQAFNHYFVKSMEVDGITVAETGSATVHPYHRIMMDHQKISLALSDKLGLNPLARQKIEIKEKRELTDMEKLIFDID